MKNVLEKSEKEINMFPKKKVKKSLRLFFTDLFMQTKNVF